MVVVAVARQDLLSLLDKLGADYTEKISMDRAEKKLKRYIEKKGLPELLTASEKRTLRGMGIEVPNTPDQPEPPGETEKGQETPEEPEPEKETPEEPEPEKETPEPEPEDEDEPEEKSKPNLKKVKGGKAKAEKSKEPEEPKKKAKKVRTADWMTCAAQAVLSSPNMAEAGKKAAQIFREAGGKVTPNTDANGKLYASFAAKALIAAGVISIEGKDITKI